MNLAIKLWNIATSGTGQSAGNVTGTRIGTKNAIDVNSLNSLVPEFYDAVAVTYPSGTQEVYAFKTGGISGTTVATVTVNYTDSTKASLLNVAKT